MWLYPGVCREYEVARRGIGKRRFTPFGFPADLSAFRGASPSSTMCFRLRRLTPVCICSVV